VTTEPVWKPLVEAIDAAFEGDLDRCENALLEALSRLRKRKQQQRTRRAD